MMKNTDRTRRQFLKISSMIPVLILISITGCSGSAPAGYPASDIKIIIPYNAGGGFDTYVRALGPYLEKHLPNKINVLPINVPGAGGRRGASDVYRASPDGYTIGVFNLPGVMLPQLQGEDVGYDLFKVSWLATISIDGYAYIVKKDSPLDSIEAVKQMGRPITYGATGPSSTSYIATTIVSDALGIPYEVVTGYTGSSEYILGVIRGDVDAAFANLSTVRPYLDSGDVKMLAIIGTESTDPTIRDATGLGIPELNNISVIRMLGAPPGLPDDIKTTLENALLAAVNDPGFQDWLKQTGNEVHYSGAAETTRSVAGMAKFYENFKQKLE